MSLQLIGLEHTGDLPRERVVMKATSDVDIGNYIVLACFADDADGLPFGGSVHAAYWISDKKVKAGDLVVLYSKAGERSEKKTRDGFTSHFVYWGKTEPVFIADVVPILVSSIGWTRLKPLAPSPE